MEFNLDKLEALAERKWFVYVREHHHGPFLESEVFGKMAEGRIDADSFVWHKGLAEWTPITDVAVFREAALVAPDFLGEEEILARSASDASGAEAETYDLDFMPVPSVLWPASFTNDFAGPDAVTDFAAVTAVAHSQLKPTRAWVSPTAMVAGILALVVTSALTAYSIHDSAFPKLKDVTVDEAAALESVASRSLTKGAAAVVAVSNADQFLPKIYVATNEPDGTRLTVHVDGVETTLLDRPRASFSYEVTVDQRGFAETPAVRFANGQTVPRGEYVLSLTCVSCQDALPGQKTVFMGGARDADYQQKLLAYNEKLRAQAQGELIELGQLVDTVVGQLRELTAQDGASLQSKSWSAFDKRWSGLQTQIESMFNQWGASFFEGEVFYGTLYRDLKGLGLAVSGLHAKLVSGEASESDYKDVRRQATDLQAKIAQASRFTPDASGRPKSDGL